MMKLLSQLTKQDLSGKKVFLRVGIFIGKIALVALAFLVVLIAAGYSFLVIYMSEFSEIFRLFDSEILEIILMMIVAVLLFALYGYATHWSLRALFEKEIAKIARYLMLGIIIAIVSLLFSSFYFCGSSGYDARGWPIEMIRVSLPSTEDVSCGPGLLGPSLNVFFWYSVVVACQRFRMKKKPHRL